MSCLIHDKVKLVSLNSPSMYEIGMI